MSGVTKDSAQTYRLYPGAEIGIKALDLSQADEETLASCISRYSYSTVSNACDYFSWLFFRISNAFAAMIGMSTTWDRAVKVLNDRMFQRLNDQGGIITSNPQNDADRVINAQVIGTVSILSTTIFEQIYMFQDIRAETTIKESKDIADLFNISNLIQRLSVKADDIRASHQRVSQS